MKYQQIATIDAVQWTGSNLIEVQAFMAPESPLTYYRNRPRTLSRLAISNEDGGLSFLEPGDYLVRHADRLQVVPKAAFESLYIPAEPVGA